MSSWPASVPGSPSNSKKPIFLSQSGRPFANHNIMVNAPLHQTQLTSVHEDLSLAVAQMQETIDQLKAPHLRAVLGVNGLYADLSQRCSCITDLVRKVKLHSNNEELQHIENLECAKVRQNELKDALERESENLREQSLQFERALAISRSEVSQLQIQVTNATQAAVEAVTGVHALMASGQPLMATPNDGAHLKSWKLNHDEPNSLPTKDCSPSAQSTSTHSKHLEDICQEVVRLNKTLADDMKHIHMLAGRFETVLGNSRSDATGNTAAIAEAAKEVVEQTANAFVAQVVSVSEAAKQALSSKISSVDVSKTSTATTNERADQCEERMALFPWLMNSSDDNSDYDQATVTLKRRKDAFVNQRSFDGGGLEEDEFAVRDPAGVERLYGWWPRGKCRTFSLEFPKFHKRSQSKSQSEQPLCTAVQHRWPEEALRECLTSHNIDLSSWANGALAKLQDELGCEQHSAALLSCKDRTQLLQLVDLVCVRVMRVRPACKGAPDKKYDSSEFEVLCRTQDSNRIGNVPSLKANAPKMQAQDFIVLPGMRWRGGGDAWEVAQEIITQQLGFTEDEQQGMKFLLPEVKEGSHEDLEESAWNITAQVSGKYLGLGGLYRRFIVDVLDVQGTLLDRAPFDCVDGKKVTKWELKPFDVVHKSLEAQAKQAMHVAKLIPEAKKLTPWTPEAVQQHLADDGIFQEITAQDSRIWQQQGLDKLVEEVCDNVSDIVRTKFGLARSQEVLKMILQRKLEEQPVQYLVEIGRWFPGQSAPVLDPRLPQATLCGKPGAMAIGQMLMAEIGVHPKFVNLKSQFVYRHRLSPPLPHFPGLASVTRSTFVRGEMDEDFIF